MTLEAAGVTDAEESAYRILVTMSNASAREFAIRSGATTADAAGTLEALTARGLASHTDGSPRLYRATPPDVALMPRLKRNADASTRPAPRPPPCWRPTGTPCAGATPASSSR